MGRLSEPMGASTRGTCAACTPRAGSKRGMLPPLAIFLLLRTPQEICIVRKWPSMQRLQTPGEALRAQGVSRQGMQSHLQSSCCFARPRKSVLYASGRRHATPATHGEALRAHGCQLVGHAAHVPHVLAAGKACYPSGNLLVASHAPGNLYCTQV